MASTSTHPRRRPASPSNCASLIESFAGLSLRKGTTFHSPTTNKSELFNPLDIASSYRSMPPRSTTSPKDLEDLLIGAGERRAADLLAKVDQVIASNSSAAALGKLLSEPEALPNPRCVLDNTSLEDISEDQREAHYDSGLGSSIADSDEFDINKAEAAAKGNAIKRSSSSTSISSSDERLSDFACEQIHKFIIKPILKEEALKDFHPLVRGVPRYIGNREITNLRDLEKTLIFLAPDYSRSPAAYLNFCETYIDCLHATVDVVHESDQCSPSDRPYTNNYFFDLVGQIRRYAQIVAATREKQERGEKLNEMDVFQPEQLRLRGGVSHTTPSQLVRHRDGKDISIATGRFLSPPPSDHVAVSSKRPMPMSEDTLDDGVERSMARRRKGEPIKTYECGFDGCEKTFRRPCDRTKHMKSHERPWKCPHTDCKYHEEGWPTEKECERHVNDKHAECPIMYACAWRNINNCPYQSKRLSNCKSHMEKAHGWEYVRSKTTKNGKTKVVPGAKEPVQQPIRIVGGVAASTPSSSSTSGTPFMQALDVPVSHSSVSSSRQGSSVPSIAQPTLTPFESPALPTQMDVDMDMNMNISPEWAGHFNFNFNMDFGSAAFAPVQYPYTPSLCEDRRPSHSSSATGTAPNSTLIQGETSFDDAIAIPPTPEDTPFTNTFDGFKFPQDNQTDFIGFLPGNQNAVNDLFSPHAQPMNGGDLTFTTPQPLANEGFGDATLMDGNDWELFNNNNPTSNFNNEPLFSDNSNLGLGTQFGEPSIKNNPYAEFFPELN